MKRFFRSTGFFLFLFSLLISIVPLILMQITFHKQAKKELERSIKTNIEKTSASAASLYFEKIREEEEWVKLVANTSPLDKDTLAEYFFIYRENFVRISVLDPEGRQLYTLVPNIERTSALPRPYDERYDMPGISRDLALETKGIISLGLLPAPDGYASRVLAKTRNGLILCDIRLSAIFTDISGDLNITGNEELFILDSNNNVVYSQNPDFLNQKIQLTASKKFISLGKNSLLGITEKDHFKFGLKVDYGDLLGSINQTLKHGLFITLILTLMIMLIIIISLRWFNHPIHSLIEGAKRISEGNFDQKIRIEYPEELKILAKRLNGMADNLKTLIKEKTQAESFSAVGKFASYFAHDIKSPLEGIYLISTEMRKKSKLGDPNTEYLDAIITGINRMRDMVTGALGFSKARNPNIEETDLNLLIQGAASEFQETVDCRISLDLSSDLIPIPIDPFLFKRLFQNLFKNSFNARKNTCEIYIKTEVNNKKIIIEVADNGKGIEEEFLDEIFEPFRSSDKRGHGFGLAFVKEVVKSHNGDIKVQSKKDQGAKFTIFLNKGK